MVFRQQNPRFVGTTATSAVRNLVIAVTMGVMFVELLRWWYGPGWMATVHRVSAWTSGIERAFSLTLLLKTLFSPWRRIISVSGRGIDAKIKAALDNLVSRLVGFVVRSIVLVAAGAATLGAFIGGLLMMVIWPLLPVAIVAFAIAGIIA